MRLRQDGYPMKLSGLKGKLLLFRLLIVYMFTSLLIVYLLHCAITYCSDVILKVLSADIQYREMHEKIDIADEYRRAKDLRKLLDHLKDQELLSKYESIDAEKLRLERYSQSGQLPTSILQLLETTHDKNENQLVIDTVKAVDMLREEADEIQDETKSIVLDLVAKKRRFDELIHA